jgi:hypothetical protein
MAGEPLFTTSGGCADTKGHWSAYDLQIDIETKYLTAIAKAWATAFYSSHPNKCLAAAAASASVN